MRSGEPDYEMSADEEGVSQAEDPLLAAIEGRYSLSIEAVSYTHLRAHET